MRNSLVSVLVAICALSLPGCQGGGNPGETQSAAETKTVPATGDVGARARELARDLIIVDTHIDVPYAQVEGEKDVSVATEDRDFDYPRGKEGGLNAAFMSIYVPASYETDGGARKLADELIDMVERMEITAPDKFAIARSTADVLRQFTDGKMSLPMGMENGAPVEGDLANLQHFYDRGIRYITLTHSKDNHICDSSFDTETQWNGLSPFGHQVVAEMNRLGIMIDVSHISDDAFYQVMELSQAPVIASHSSCRKFTPGWQRNMGDDMVKLLAAADGVIQINFGSAFLTQEANQQSTDYWAAYTAFLEESGHARGSDEARGFREEYWQDRTRAFADVADVVAHIDHVVQLAGVDHVGLGSDFDGVGDSLPTGLKDVSGYPNLIAALLEKGYSEADIEKICGGNLLRVWRQVERVARDVQKEQP